MRAAMVAKGLVIEVEDRGLGMSEEDYASLNEQLAVGPAVRRRRPRRRPAAGRMFVIARLAVRHGIAVTLRSSPCGGTTAIRADPARDRRARALDEPAPVAAKGADEAVTVERVAAAAEKAAEMQAPRPGRCPPFPGAVRRAAGDRRSRRARPVATASAAVTSLGQ
ncbi:hypothetical protein ACRAWF_32315 [Streptomyces sp. L7]